MKDSKEVERSLWSRIGAGIDGHEVVGAKRGVVDVAVREGTVMLPAKRVLSRIKITVGEIEREIQLNTLCSDNKMKDLCGDNNIIATHLKRLVVSECDETSKLSENISEMYQVRATFYNSIVTYTYIMH